MIWMRLDAYAMLPPDKYPQAGRADKLLTQLFYMSRAVVTYATAICLTVNDNDHDTVKQALSALKPLATQSTVRARHCRPSVGTPELMLIRSAAEAPLPA
jgi:hypothetical protein